MVNICENISTSNEVFIDFSENIFENTIFLWVCAIKSHQWELNTNVLLIWFKLDVLLLSDVTDNVKH